MFIDKIDSFVSVKPHNSFLLRGICNLYKIFTTQIPEKQFIYDWNIKIQESSTFTEFWIHVKKFIKLFIII